MPVDKDRMKALALAATKGPWKMATDWDRAAVYSETHMVPRYQGDQINKRVVCSGNQNNIGRWSKEDWSGADWQDAEYIAAANPTAVLELLAENDKLEQERDELRAEVERLKADAERYQNMKAADFTAEYCEYTSNRLNGFAEFDLDAAIAAHSKAGKP